MRRIAPRPVPGSLSATPSHLPRAEDASYCPQTASGRRHGNPSVMDKRAKAVQSGIEGAGMSSDRAGGQATGAGSFAASQSANFAAGTGRENR
jgi:hypothetical protein